MGWSCRNAGIPDLQRFLENWNKLAHKRRSTHTPRQVAHHFCAKTSFFVAEWFYRKGRSEAPAFLYVTNPSTGSLKGNKSITIFTLWNNFQNHNMQVNHARYLYSKSIFPWNHLVGQIGESQKKRFYFFCAFFSEPPSSRAWRFLEKSLGLAPLGSLPPGNPDRTWKTLPRCQTPLCIDLTLPLLNSK